MINYGIPPRHARCFHCVAEDGRWHWRWPRDAFSPAAACSYSKTLFLHDDCRDEIRRHLMAITVRSAAALALENAVREHTSRHDVKHTAERQAGLSMVLMPPGPCS